MEKSRVDRLVDLNDLFQTLVIASSVLIVRTVPPFRWQGIARNLAALALRVRPGRTRKGVAKLDRFVPDGHLNHETNRQLLLRITASHLEEVFLLAKLRQDRAFRPAIKTEGKDAVASAVGQGRGVLLWTAPQVFTPLLVRMLAHDEGWPINHLRLWAHGPSSTRYARRFLNHTQLRAENQYANHIVISKAGPMPAVLEVSRRLREGQVVQFHGVSNSGNPVSVPLFQGRMDLAAGAPRIALQCGAALLAVAATRSPDSGTFLIKFVPLLPSDGLDPPSEHDEPEIVREAVEKFRTLLEDSFSVSPNLWPIQRLQYRSD